jgi:hypothetical protein
MKYFTILSDILLFCFLSVILLFKKLKGNRLCLKFC